MKTLLAICLLAAAPFTWGQGAATPASAGPSTAGTTVGKSLPPGHPSVTAAVTTEAIQVPKASGANAQTVEEVNIRRAELKEQVVLVRGKVVDYSPRLKG